MTVMAVCTVSAYGQTTNADKQKLAELTADRMMKRFYETLQFKTIWDEFYVKDEKLRNLEVEAITFRLVLYRAERLPYTRITMAARRRAYIAQKDFWMTLSAAVFTSGNAPRDDKYARRYESITQRPKPYANSDELDHDFVGVMNELGNVNRKLVVAENVGSAAYQERLEKFRETNPADVKKIREVFAETGLKPQSPLYVVQREMFHIYMIEEDGQLRVLTILNRERG